MGAWLRIYWQCKVANLTKICNGFLGFPYGERETYICQTNLWLTFCVHYVPAWFDYNNNSSGWYWLFLSQLTSCFTFRLPMTRSCIPVRLVAFSWISFFRDMTHVSELCTNNVLETGRTPTSGQDLIVPHKSERFVLPLFNGLDLLSTRINHGGSKGPSS